MKRKKKKWKRYILISIILICLIVFVFSSFKILEWYFDSKKTKEQIQNIQEIIKVEEIIENEEVEIIKQEEEIPPFNPYWDYIKMSLINVDFNELKKINNNTKGWIFVNGTNVNYPVVQANDNNYYLTHSFDNSYNYAGWVFLDYRNKLDKEDKNTIIYAHGRNDNTMFGSLRNILKSSWLNNTDNHVVKFSSEEESSLWQVFSVYRIPTTSDYIKVNFNSDDEYINWLKMLKDRSIYNFQVNLSENDKILTLSTCYDDYDKIVLHAKLIKRL